MPNVFKRVTDNEKDAIMAMTYQDIINGISEKISSEMKQFNGEFVAPRMTADGMDDFLKLKKENVQLLRKIRSELEEIATDYRGGL